MELNGMKTTNTQPQSDHNTGPNGTISPNQIYPQGGWGDQNGTGDPNYLPTDPFLSETRTDNGKKAKSFNVIHLGSGHDPNKSPADCPACGQEIAGHLNQIFSTTENGQLRHGDVMVVTSKNRRLGIASGVIRGLRQASVPVRVQRKKSCWPCSSNQEETDNQVLVVDTARNKEHPVERRVVVCVQSKKSASSAKDVNALVEAYAASAAIVIVVVAVSHAHVVDEGSSCCEDCYDSDCDCSGCDCSGDDGCVIS